MPGGISIATLRALGLALGLAAAPLAALAQGGPPPGGGAMPGMMPTGPAEVGTVTLATEDVPLVRTLAGRALASEQTDIRPRVSGMVEEILFDPGQEVAAGDPLFRIEDATYRAAVASAAAALASAEASAAVARANVERYRTLQGSAVTEADLQAAEATAASAEAALAAAQVTLDLAELDLSRATITSPIAGTVGVSQVSVGALVTANQADALTTVTLLDPIHVDASDSSAGMLRTRAMIESGDLTPGEGFGVELLLETGAPYATAGTLVALSSEVSTTTGMVDFRVRFDNPDRLILPGQFLRMNITLGTTRAILVPQRATSRASDGSLTAWIAQDGTAAKVTLTTTGTYGSNWVVTEGVADGDALIVDGLSNLVDGTEVTTVAVEIDALGVVRETGGTAAEAGIPAGEMPAGAPSEAPAGTAAEAPAEAPAEGN